MWGAKGRKALKSVAIVQVTVRLGVALAKRQMYFATRLVISAISTAKTMKLLRLFNFGDESDDN